MRIVNRLRLEQFRRTYTDAAHALAAWAQTVGAADWQNIAEVRQTYAHADAARVRSGLIVTIFNVRGNRYRLIAAIDYPTQIVNVLDFMTHAQYSKRRWKDRL